MSSTGLPNISNPAQRLSALRAVVQERRSQIQKRLLAGDNGVVLTATMSSATDSLLVQLITEACANLPANEQSLLPEHMAVLAVGGTGRGELAPYSDIDLLFLIDSRMASREPILNCISQIVRDCWDIGLKLGHSVRTLNDALAMARSDLQFATSIVESRLLWGATRLSDYFQKRFVRSVIRPRISAFIDECIASRHAETEESGGTIQQLEPDVKKSVGGLRDLHLLRWVAFAKFQTTDLHLLQLQGVLTREEVHTLREAHEYLCRLRVDLHLTAGKPQDLLSRDEQLRITAARQIEELPGQRAVERFMQEYFQQTTRLSHIVRRFVSKQRGRSRTKAIYRYLMSHRSDGHFLVSNDEVDVTESFRVKLCSSLEEVLRLYELCSLTRVNLSDQLTEQLQLAAPGLTPISNATEAALALSIFGRGAHLGPILRSLYETGLLEKIIPEFGHTRCLLQFNQYHSYTVDEHSLRAVEAVVAFESDPGPLGEAYRAIRLKEVLHLAVLIHDIGKGFSEDHSEVGRRIAESVALRLGLPQHLREILMFLVHKHLVMPDLAFRRDITDPEVYLPFSREVGSPEILRMLYVLSAADITAVGPTAWTNWKAGLVNTLFEKSFEVLSGESSHVREKERVERQRELTRQEIAPWVAQANSMLTWKRVDELLETLPPNLTIQTPPEELAAVVRLVAQLGEHDVQVRSAYDPHTHTVEYRIITRDQPGSGQFSKMAGALTAKRLEILSAEIATSTDGVILDRFLVVDYDYAGEVPEIRREEVTLAIAEVLQEKRTIAALFAANKRFESQPATVSHMPTRVVIDNDSTERFTIIDVFAHDRTGLLYVITRTLVELKLSVALAKIGTHLDQVVDVFYVTEQSGLKISSGHRLADIRTALERRIEDFEQSGLPLLEQLPALAPGSA